MKYILIVIATILIIVLGYKVQQEDEKKTNDVDISTSTTNKVISGKQEIGKGLTLENIRNKDVSDAEKDRMLSDLAYYGSKHKDRTKGKVDNLDNEIGKGLTLENINAANVSDAEKDRMLSDLAYYGSKHRDRTKENSTENQIGQGLTLESINEANVSDSEKTRMLADLAYYANKHSNRSEKVTEQTIYYHNMDRKRINSVMTKHSFDKIDNEIGQGLSIEMINTSDATDSEKDRMLSDLAYYANKHRDKTISVEQESNLYYHDLENGILPQNKRNKQ